MVDSAAAAVVLAAAPWTPKSDALKEGADEALGAPRNEMTPEAGDAVVDAISVFALMKEDGIATTAWDEAVLARLRARVMAARTVYMVREILAGKRRKGNEHEWNRSGTGLM